MVITTFSQPKGARASPVNKLPFVSISALTSMSATPASPILNFRLIASGATFNSAHSSSNRPGVGVAVLCILHPVDPSIYANYACCSTAAFLPVKNGSIDVENDAILVSLVSEAPILGVCTTDSAPTKILLIRGLVPYFFRQSPEAIPIFRLLLSF